MNRLADVYRFPRTAYARPPAMGDALVTLTANTDNTASALGSNPLVTLLLGAALGAGLAGLIFSWK